MKIASTTIFVLLLATMSIGTTGKHRARGHHSVFRGRHHHSDDLDFVDPGCTESDLVTCELSPRRRHYSEDTMPVEGLYVCREVKPKGRRGPMWMVDEDDEEEESIPASLCVPTDRTIQGDTCGCCGGDCDPCTCGCDLTLKNGTVAVGAGVYVDVLKENFQGQMCVPRVKAVTMIDMSDGDFTCKPEPCG